MKMQTNPASVGGPNFLFSNAVESAVKQIYSAPKQCHIRQNRTNLSRDISPRMNEFAYKK